MNIRIIVLFGRGLYSNDTGWTMQEPEREEGSCRTEKMP